MSNQYDQLVERVLHNLLVILANGAHDPATSGIKALMGGPEVGRALERASDTAACFVLREVRHIVADHRQPPSAAVVRIMNIVNEFNRFRNSQRSEQKRKKPSAQ